MADEPIRTDSIHNWFALVYRNSTSLLVDRKPDHSLVFFRYWVLYLASHPSNPRVQSLYQFFLPVEQSSAGYHSRILGTQSNDAGGVAKVGKNVDVNSKPLIITAANGHGKEARLDRLSNPESRQTTLDDFN
jgi:hypothetical protein